jgi:hypothetical protein
MNLILIIILLIILFIRINTFYIKFFCNFQFLLRKFYAIFIYIFSFLFYSKYLGFILLWIFIIHKWLILLNNFLILKYTLSFTIRIIVFFITLFIYCRKRSILNKTKRGLFFYIIIIKYLIIKYFIFGILFLFTKFLVFIFDSNILLRLFLLNFIHCFNTIFL